MWKINTIIFLKLGSLKENCDRIFHISQLCDFSEEHFTPSTYLTPVLSLEGLKYCRF